MGSYSLFLYSSIFLFSFQFYLPSYSPFLLRRGITEAIPQRMGTLSPDRLARMFILCSWASEPGKSTCSHREGELFKPLLQNVSPRCIQGRVVQDACTTLYRCWHGLDLDKEDSFLQESSCNKRVVNCTSSLMEASPACVPEMQVHTWERTSGLKSFTVS